MTPFQLLDIAEDYAADHDKYADFFRHYREYRVENGIEFSIICAMQKIGLFDSFFKDKLYDTIRRTQILS